MATEIIDSVAFEAGRVDAAAGVVHRLKLLDSVSRRGRTYPANVLQTAVGLFRGTKVNINHVPARAGTRSYLDRLGIIRSPFLEGGVVYGDLHFNQRHPLAAQFAWDAANDPGTLELVLNLRGTISHSGGKATVTSIVQVPSIDLAASMNAAGSAVESVGDDPCAGLTVAEVLEARPEIRKHLVEQHQREQAETVRLLQEQIGSVLRRKVERERPLYESALGRLEARSERLTEALTDRVVGEDGREYLDKFVTRAELKKTLWLNDDAIDALVRLGGLQVAKLGATGELFSLNAVRAALAKLTGGADAKVIPAKTPVRVATEALAGGGESSRRWN